MKASKNSGVFRIILLLISILLFSDISCLAVSKGIFAYVVFANGDIGRYKVTPDGQFLPIPGADSHAAVCKSRIVIDSDKNFAYCLDGKDICQFKINDNGSLSILKKIAIRTDKDPIQLVIDNTNRFIYVTLNTDDGGDVAQYRINKNGSLSPLHPAFVKVGAAPCSLATPPNKQVLYVLNFVGGSVSQFTIRPSGKLAPLHPAKVVVGDPSNIAFSKDGHYAYVVDSRSQWLNRFKVKKNGSLESVGDAGYGNDYEMCCGYVTIAAGPQGSVFVSDAASQAVYEFDFSPKKKLTVTNHYKLTRDNRLKTMEELISSIRQSNAKNGEQPLPVDEVPEDINQMNAEIMAINDATARIYGLAFGPDNVLYVLNTSGIARFRVGNGSLSSEAPAIAWPDIKERAMTYYKTRTGINPYYFSARELTFFTRK